MFEIRLPPDEALRFAGQLPARLQGLFLEGWARSSRQGSDQSDTAFVRQIATALLPGFPRDPETVVRASFKTAYDRLDGGEVDKVVRHLPRHVRELWLDDIG